MSTMVDNPVVGVALVVLACLMLFAPAVLGHFRPIRAWRSVSALNGLTVLLVVCFILPGFLFWGLWPPLLWGTLALWLASVIWSLTGRRRDS